MNRAFALALLLCLLALPSLARAGTIVTVVSPTGKTLYAQMDTSSAQLARFEMGMQFEVISAMGGWLSVRAGEFEGYTPAGGTIPNPAQPSTPVPIQETTAQPTASPTPALMFLAYPVEDMTAVVNNPDPRDRLHLRTRPDENAPSLGKYYNGVIVNIGAVEGDWVAVSVGGLEGYMMRQFLSFDSAVEVATPTLRVHNDNSLGNLNLRAEQSTSSKSLGLYDSGTLVTLLGFTNEWAHVSVDGQTGFMMLKFLRSEDGSELVLEPEE